MKAFDRTQCFRRGYDFVTEGYFLAYPDHHFILQSSGSNHRHSNKPEPSIKFEYVTLKTDEIESFYHNPEEPEPNRKKLFVFGFYESPGSKIQWFEFGRFGKSEYH